VCARGADGARELLRGHISNGARRPRADGWHRTRDERKIPVCHLQSERGMNPTAGERSQGSEKIRILYCIDAMEAGGTEKQLAALIRGLERSQFQPLLCTLRPSTLSLADLDCPTLELPLRSFASVSALACLAALRRFIVQHRVD